MDLLSVGMSGPKAVKHTFAEIKIEVRGRMTYVRRDESFFETGWENCLDVRATMMPRRSWPTLSLFRSRVTGTRWRDCGSHRNWFDGSAALPTYDWRLPG